MSENVLEVNGLVKEFDGKRAVDDISFILRQGEIMGMLGPNGAGKTTTIRMIMNIIAPDAGSIKILGRKFSEEMKNRVGYLPEERGLYRKMKIMDTLVFLGGLKGLKAAEVRKSGQVLLEQFGLADYRDKKVEELSKGMAQKLQFIATILHEPDLLILDEPFSGLDPLNIELVKDIMLEKKRQGIPIIYSTHLMEYAEKTVDTVVMINKGAKVLDGSLRQIKAEHGKKLLRVICEGDSSFVAGLPYVKEVRSQGRELEIELFSTADKEKLLSDILGKVSLLSFSVADPSLANIFLQKVNSGEDK